MCRMILSIGKTALGPLLDALQQMAQDKTTMHELNREKGLGSWKHGDGWGIAYLEKGGWVVKKATKAIYDDPATELLRDKTVTLAVLHVRKSSSTKVAPENTHPFLARAVGKEIIFCHNGTIKEPMYCDPKYQLQGETDTEHLLYSILTDLQGTDFAGAVQKNLFQYTQTEGSNIFLATREHSIVGLQESAYPLYMQMWKGQKEKNLIISSEKITTLRGFSWSLLSLGTVVEIDQQSQKFHTRKLLRVEQPIPLVNG